MTTVASKSQLKRIVKQQPTWAREMAERVYERLFVVGTNNMGVTWAQRRVWFQDDAGVLVSDKNAVNDQIIAAIVEVLEGR